MYSDNTWITPLRIAEAHRQAEQERSLRPTELAPRVASPRTSRMPALRTAVSTAVDTRAAGEPIAVVGAAAVADDGACRNGRSGRLIRDLDGLPGRQVRPGAARTAR